MELAPGQSFTVNATYTLVGVKNIGGQEYMDIAYTATSNVPGYSMEMGNMPDGSSLKMTMSMAMNMSGNTLFDNAAGEIYQSTYTGSVKTTVTPEGGSSEMGTTMNMNMTGTVKRK